MNAIVKSETPAAITAYLKVIQEASANPNIDVTKLEKLLDMQERVINHHAEVSFNHDYAEMQGEMPVITKYGEIKVGGVVRSTYAKFEDINENIKPILQKYGFAVTFKVNTADNKVKVTGILMHKDGHREETEMTLDADTSGSKNSVQSVGSSTQYGKRYTLCALLNVTTQDEDDDGNAGGKPVESCWKGPRERMRYVTDLQRAWGKGDGPGFVQLWDELELDQKKDAWSDFNSTQRNEMKEMIAAARKVEPSPNAELDLTAS